MHLPSFAVTVFAFLLAVGPTPALADDGRVVGVSKGPYADVVAGLQRGITEHKLTLIGQFDSRKGVPPTNTAVKGNRVLLVYKTDAAMRLIKANPKAGFDAPMRFHVFENPDGTATVTYVKPSTLLKTYRDPEIRKVADELDLVFTSVMGLALIPKF